jgi:2-keto-4-pentenoate hydratase/2-oxohepta-3-ene-1,7-dioic acid hydratase in catechol pathway
MRLLSFTLPNDPAPRTGVLAHDGARVVDLTEIGVASFAEGAARAERLARLASHLLHMPGAVAHAPGAVRLLAPATSLVAVYDAATGVAAAPLAADAASAAGLTPLAPDAAVPLAPGVELGAGLACIVGRPTHDLAPGDAEAHVAGLALVLCWRAGTTRIEAAVLGPWAATLDEFTAPRAAPLAVAVDAALAVNAGVARGGSWAALSAKLAPALADASRRQPLHPGAAVAVVTFEAAREPASSAAGDAGLHQLRGRFSAGSAPGDELVVEATHLGALRARVAPGRHAADR